MNDRAKVLYNIKISILLDGKCLNYFEMRKNQNDKSVIENFYQYYSPSSSTIKMFLCKIPLKSFGIFEELFRKSNISDFYGGNLGKSTVQSLDVSIYDDGYKQGEG